MPLIEDIVRESIEVTQQAVEENKKAINDAAKLIAEALKNGNKVLLFGNGGSAADSQHIAAEFIGRFQKERQSLAAVALTTDSSILTALGNDYGIEAMFSRQIEGLGKKGDIAVGISTSGNSRNVIEAFLTAKQRGLKTVSLTGCGGGECAKLTDVCIIVPSQKTARIQEAHSCIGHIICELVEDSA